MDLTILGKSPSWSDVNGAGSAYLVEAAGTTLLLDCGQGAFGKLRAARDYGAVDAVMLSHLHPDHVLDVVAFASALAFGPRAGELKPRLLLPPGGTEAFGALLAGTFMPDWVLGTAFAIEEYAPGDELEVGGLAVRLAAVPHFGVPTVAVSVATEGKRLVYGADHGPSDAVVALAAGADLALLEATLPEPETDEPRGHLTPREAGEHARRAEVGRLVLTHFTDELDAGWVRAEGERGFGGAVELAAAGASYAV